ncbi:MAG: [Fe-Fe] hydrogenase large subunit C-terminal domain-containing protein [Negativicutes bacterium]|nr:[Fe-Fe] hydrogenase large subunit C-terminal domain-containing protein [Negativicutes bacterium]
MSDEILRTNSDLCVGCNKCIAKCPVKANVAFRHDGKNKVRVDQEKCIHCGECIGACDHGVRDFADDTERFFADLEQGVKISLLVAPAVRFNFPQYKRLFGYLRTKGVGLIYDVALGAEIVVWAYLRVINERQLESVIAQPCPVVVNYIQKYRPTLIEHLSPIHSPMVCTAIYLKKYAGEDGKIAFLSPCIGKVDEIASVELVDYNVTFAKLANYIEARNVDLDRVAEVDYDRVGHGIGLIFSRSGGLRENIRYYTDDAWVRQIEGAPHSFQYLDEYAERIRSGEPVPLIVDILNCQYGCNRGTGTTKNFAIDAMDSQMNALKRKIIQNDDPGPGSARQLLQFFDQELRLGDFIRGYEDKSGSLDRIDGMDLETVFSQLYKTTEESRNINCYACGYGSCQAFAQAVAEGANHLSNCIDYNRKALINEKEHSIQLHKQYEAVVNQALEAIVLVDKSSKGIIAVNPSYLKMAGFSEEEVRRLTLFDIIEGGADVHESLTVLDRKGRLTSRIRHLKTKHGDTCEVERTAVVIYQDNREVYLFNFRDVTKQRRLEHESYKELQAAGRIQRALLPEDDNNKQVEIRIIYSPFSEVSGDFLHYKWDESHKVLSGYLFDITGHGVATAMQTAAVRVILDEILNSADISIDIMLQINARLKQYFEQGTFIALLLFEMDLDTELMKLATGGINQIPVSLSTRQDLLTIEGGYLGLLDEPDVDMMVIPVMPNDKYYFCTDGLLDLISDQSLDLKNFALTMDQLEHLSRSPQKFDDCSALCIHIKAVRSFPKTYEIFSQKELPFLQAQLNRSLKLYSPTVAFETELVMNEAINNALAAGTRVRVKVKRIGTRLVIRVKDDGKGFAGNERLEYYNHNPIDEGLSEQGRGIFLMKAYCDKIFYNRRGNEVFMMKLIDRQPIE